jgi:hypothetical protein
LIIVTTVGSITFNSSNCRFTGIKGDDIVDQGLTLGTERNGFGRIGRPVLRCRGLANFKLFSWNARHDCDKVCV